MLNNQEVLSATVEFIDTTATAVTNEEFKKYTSDNPGDLITEDIVKLVRERMHSELTLLMGNFSAGKDNKDLDDLYARIRQWFSTEEEDHLRTMCQSCIKEEIKKRQTAGEEENLSFTDKYLRAVKANSKPGGKTIRLKDL